MKKQIFISIFILAIFATTTVFGQPFAVTGTKSVPLTCPTTDPLTPIAGRPYDYSAVIAPANGTAFWYATKSTTFTTAGARVATIIPADGVAILTGATNYNTSIPNATSPNKTTVTWTSAGLDGVNATTNPLFMVVEYAGPSACADNLKVMQIVPKIAFTVDITNMVHGATPTSLAYGVAESQCFDKVQSAKWNVATGKVETDYGTNILYYEVVAANFTDSYKPTLKLSGLQGTQTATIAWGYTAGTIATNLVTDAAAPGVTTSQFTVQTTQPLTNEGVSIYIKVTIKNNGFEGLVDVPVTLAVEAVDGTATANKDVDPDCTTFTDFGDLAVQTLSLRPTVTTTPVSLPQVP